VRALTITPDHELVLATRPDPQPGPGEVLVRVHGAGLNRADLAQLAGRYPAPPGSPPDIPGMEFAGVVVAHGPGAGAGNTPAVGDRVFGIVGGGAQAELVVVPTGQCAVVPETLDLVAAGAVPEAFITAHDAMVTRAALTTGETVLIHAVGSGVGTAALQLAKAMRCRVVGTARSRDKLERSLELGLDHAVHAPRELDPAALADEILAVGGSIAVVVELVGGRYLEVDVRAAARRGRIVLIGTMAGATAPLDIGSTMGKRLTIFGTVLRGRDLAEKAAATSAFTRDVVPLLASGRVAPVIACALALDDARDAYKLLAADAVFGKIVLQPN
jgi:putative PIG3 family NAD(P)H quinone oxidoreductase